MQLDDGRTTGRDFGGYRNLTLDLGSVRPFIMRIELGKEEGVGIKISTAENYPRGREYSDENLFGTFAFPMTVRPRRKTSFHNFCYYFFFFGWMVLSLKHILTSVVLNCVLCSCSMEEL